MNKPTKYILTKEELVVQIHHTLRELFPDRIFSPNEIKNSLVADDSGITFMVPDFARINDMETADIIQKLYIELGIEFEKNLHDKFYFVMTKDNESLHFKTVWNDGWR